MSAMQTAVSGMKGQSNRLKAVSDNIANAGTVGYKKVSAEFLPLVMPSGTSSYNSGGVETRMRRAVSIEGGLLSTASKTDLALRGKGFFVVEDSSGARMMTRAGSYVTDPQGFLVNAAGHYLTGYDIRNGEPAVLLNSIAGGERININSINMQANPSISGVFSANLDERSVIIPAGSLPSDNVAASDFTSKSSIVVYDMLGGEVTLDIYFAKKGPVPPAVNNTWEVTVYNHAHAAAGGGFPYTAVAPYAAPSLGTLNLTFDALTGRPLGGTALNVNLSNAAAGDQAIVLDLSRMMQLKAAYEVVEVQVDGNAPSNSSGVTISEDGVVSFSMENGATIKAYRISLADVPSPDNLTALSGGAFLVNQMSGAPKVGFAGQGGFGLVRTGALEASNVDMAEELATMIEAQRNYTANSKVFQTDAEVIEVTVNLKR